MSRILRFYGASDDLFEIDGTGRGEPDEIGCFDHPAAVEVKASDGRLIVTAHYGPAPANVPCWSIGVMPSDEDVPIPTWPISFSLSDRGYSSVLTIQAPDDATVAEVKAK